MEAGAGTGWAVRLVPEIDRLIEGWNCDHPKPLAPRETKCSEMDQNDRDLLLFQPGSYQSEAEYGFAVSPKSCSAGGSNPRASFIRPVVRSPWVLISS